MLNSTSGASQVDHTTHLRIREARLNVTASQSPIDPWRRLNAVTHADPPPQTFLSLAPSSRKSHHRFAPALLLSATFGVTHNIFLYSGYTMERMDTAKQVHACHYGCSLTPSSSLERISYLTKGYSNDQPSGNDGGLVAMYAADWQMHRGHQKRDSILKSEKSELQISINRPATVDLEMVLELSNKAGDPPLPTRCWLIGRLTLNHRFGRVKVTGPRQFDVGARRWCPQVSHRSCSVVVRTVCPFDN